MWPCIDLKWILKTWWQVWQLTADLWGRLHCRPWSPSMMSCCRLDRQPHGWLDTGIPSFIYSRTRPSSVHVCKKRTLTDLRLPPRTSTLRQILRPDAFLVVYKTTANVWEWHLTACGWNKTLEKTAGEEAGYTEDAQREPICRLQTSSGATPCPSKQPKAIKLSHVVF